MEQWLFLGKPLCSQDQELRQVSISRLFDPRQPKDRLRTEAQSRVLIRDRDLSPSRLDQALSHETLQLSSKGHAVECAVKMMRFNGGATLNHLARGGAVGWARGLSAASSMRSHA